MKKNKSAQLGAMPGSALTVTDSSGPRGLVDASFRAGGSVAELKRWVDDSRVRAHGKMSDAMKARNDAHALYWQGYWAALVALTERLAAKPRQQTRARNGGGPPDRGKWVTHPKPSHGLPE